MFSVYVELRPCPDDVRATEKGEGEKRRRGREGEEERSSDFGRNSQIQAHHHLASSSVVYAQLGRALTAISCRSADQSTVEIATGRE